LEGCFITVISKLKKNSLIKLNNRMDDDFDNIDFEKWEADYLLIEDED